MAKENTTQAGKPNEGDGYVAEMQAELAAVKAQLAEERRRAEAAEAQVAASGAPALVKGEYKGYAFDPNHRRVRDQEGRLGDTQQLLDAANNGDAEASRILDWLIDIGYAHFQPVKAEPAE